MKSVRYFKQTIGCRKRTIRRGFSLVELMIVIAIIGVLATLVIVRYSGKVDQAKVAAAKSQITQLENAVIEFQASCNRYPNSLDELVNQPADCPDWQRGGYLKKKKLPKDPWNNEFIYRLDGSEFELVCLGADKQEGGTGIDRDLSNMSLEEVK